MGKIGLVGPENYGSIMGGVFVFDVLVQSNQMREGFQHLREGCRQHKDVVGNQIGFGVWITVLAQSILPLKHLGLDGPLELFSESEGRSGGPLRRVDDDVGYRGINGLISER